MTPAFQRTWAGLILTLTVAPYLAHFLATPAGYTYAWIMPPYPADAYAYRAWSKQSYDGNVLFSLKYTGLPHRPFLFQPFFLACGWCARLAGIDIGIVHLLAKSLGVLLFLRVFFKFLESLQLGDVPASIAAILAGISSGFGGVLQEIGGHGLRNRINPVDLWLVDSNTFWSLLWNPLFPYSLSLMLLCIYLTDKGASEKRPNAMWAGGACLALLALIHPYPVGLLYPLLALVCVMRLKSAWLAYWGRVVAASLPGTLYVAALSLRHPLLKWHGVSGDMPAPAPASYLLGFGAPLLLALFGLYSQGWAFVKRYWLLWSWVGLAFLLAYCPFWFRAKFIFGVHIPLCILAGAAWGTGGRKPAKPAYAAAGGLALLAFVSYSQIRLCLDAWAEVKRNPDEDYRISNGMLAALKYLDENSSPSDIVFASVEISAKIPAYSGNTVLWGHWAQAVDYRQRKDWYEALFDADSGWDEARRNREFWRSGIKYALLDATLLRSFDGQAPRWLTAGADKVFENATTRIYRRKDALSGIPRAR